MGINYKELIKKAKTRNSNIYLTKLDISVVKRSENSYGGFVFTGYKTHGKKIIPLIFQGIVLLIK